MSRHPFVMDPLETRALLAAISWDGGGGDNLWSNPLNWSGDVLPGAGDTAAINVPGSNPQIEFTTGVAEIASLKCSEALHISGGLLRTTAESWMLGDLTVSGGTLDTAFWKQLGAFNMSAGTLTGAGPFIVAGGATWTGGFMSGTGKVQLPAGSPAFTISGNMQLERPFVVNTVLNWTSGDVILAQGAEFRVLAGRTLQIPEGQGSFSGFSGGLFLSGALVGSGYIGANFWAGGPGASISVAAGKQLTVGPGSIACPVHVPAGATLAIDTAGSGQDVCFRSGAAVSGPGNLLVAEGMLRVLTPGLVFPRMQIGHPEGIGGALLVEEAVSIGRIDLLAGNIGVVGGETLTITDQFNMMGGSLYSQVGPGLIKIAKGAAMSIKGAVGLGGTIVRVRNEGHVSLDMAGSKTVPIVIENLGTLTKGGPGKMTIAGLTGDGAATLAEGTLEVGSADGHGYGGKMSIAQGAKALLRDSFHLLASGSIIGQGALQLGLPSNFTTVIQGAVQVPVVQVSSDVIVTGPGFAPGHVTIDDLGSIKFMGVDDAHTSGSFVMEGDIAGSQLEFWVRGPNPSQFPALDVGGTLNIAGTADLMLQFQNYVPKLGDTFELMTFGARTGQFEGVSGVGLPFGLDLNIQYLSDRVRVVIVQV